MMPKFKSKKSLFVLFAGVLFFTGNPSRAQNTITLEDIWQKYTYYPKGIDEFRSMADGKSYTQMDENGVISRFDLAEGKKLGVLFPAGDLGRFESYTLSPKEDKILLAAKREPIYRHSFAAEYWIFDPATQRMDLVAKPGKLIYPSFSPEGNSMAFILENNLWVKNMNTGETLSVTSDGEKNKIINGLPDWVYEEEFTMYQAYSWSPDGKKIAWLRFDETDVPSFTMPLFKGNLYPENEVFKYPKVGQRNSQVTLWMYDLAAAKSVQIDIPVKYEYIPRFAWIDESTLAVFTMNRLQNELHIHACKPADASSRLILRETSSTYIEITDDYRFLSPDKGFLWTSERDGFRHVYHYDYLGNLKKQITSGNWDVTALYGTDAAARKVFYQSAEVSPLERRVYGIGLDGKNKQDLTPFEGWNEAEFSAGCRYFVHTRSTMATPPEYSIFDASGKSVRLLEDNAGLKAKLKALDLPAPEFLKLRGDEGSLLNAWMLKPPGFSEAKKYPVFMYVYGGPGSQTVKNQWSWSNYLWFRMLAQEGYVVVSADNRGTGGRGRDFRAVTYEKLGRVETDDQIAAAMHLGEMPFVDKSRIGIFGWSYGGYMSSLCITRGADVFKTAIAVAPVTNWKFYDNIYTERYMGTLETNPNGYDDNAPMKFADQLKGKYLLVHGTADDNVHWQNAAEMINALVKANKQFDQFIYPDRNHGIGGGNTRYHLYTLMTNYIRSNL
jgi:dipeptidyl-peptidase-4